MPSTTKDALFIMQSARVVLASGGMYHIEEQVKALELAVVENPGYAFDLAKTLVESGCKTILAERGVDFDNSDDLPKLFKTVCQCMPFLPVMSSGEIEVRRSLEQTLNGLSTTLQGICELRNACGFSSHGSDKPRPLMERTQALLAAQSADAIIGFLYQIHRKSMSSQGTGISRYDDYSEFNDWLDEQCEPICILSLPPYRPSDVLFNVDREAYRDLLANYTSEEYSHLEDAEQEEGL